MNEIHIATKLYELRMKKGVTQDEVAGALSVSNKTISKWENGVSSPDLTALVALAQYYGVSTDALLGLEEDHKDADQMIANAFRGLDRHKTARKVFEITRDMIPAIYKVVVSESETVCNNEDAIPTQTVSTSRYQIALNELFDFAVCSDDVNLAVIQLRNKSNFSWLLDENKQNRIIRLLRLLADVDAIKILSFIHSDICSENFTATYVSDHADVPLDNAMKVLEEFVEIKVCDKVTAHLKSGEVTVYESFGDGLILSLLSIAYERMCGKNSYNYNFNNSCKMIGGKLV